MSSDAYEALGVKRTSSKDEIKAAYRKLALQFHPDRCACLPVALQTPHHLCCRTYTLQPWHCYAETPHRRQLQLFGGYRRPRTGY